MAVEALEVDSAVVAEVASVIEVAEVASAVAEAEIEVAMVVAEVSVVAEVDSVAIEAAEVEVEEALTPQLVLPIKAALLLSKDQDRHSEENEYLIKTNKYINY